MRLCKKCGETKELTEFYPQTSSCKTCKNAYTVAKRRENPERVNEYRRSLHVRRRESVAIRRRTPEGKAKELYYHMRGYNSKRGFPTPEFSIEEVLTAIRGVCCKTHIPFVFDPSPSSVRNPFTPSPDRINPNLGYSRSNVQWVCWIYNAMKSDFSQEDVTVFIKGLLTHHD